MSYVGPVIRKVGLAMPGPSIGVKVEAVWHQIVMAIVPHHTCVSVYFIELRARSFYCL